MNLQDKRGSTPLHWACYSNSEIALSFLLAWGPELNNQDQDGFTPLHLAVKNVDQVESTRPVRWLLQRGADTSIRDNNNETPIDFVTNGIVKDEEFKSDLNKLLVSRLRLSSRSALYLCIERTIKVPVPHALATNATY